MGRAGEASFAEVSRAVRAAFGFAQEDWAAHLHVSRKTVQRWERGLGAPDDRVEMLLGAFYYHERVFDRVAALAALGVTDWPALVDTLIGSRRGRAPRRAPATVASTVFGRDDDLVAVARLVESNRLVTLTGPGGIGKTTLARAVTRQHAHGTLFVELAHVRSGDLVLGEIAAGTGFVLNASRSLREQVVAALEATHRSRPATTPPVPCGRSAHNWTATRWRSSWPLLACG